jgi:hypothetical protein
MLGANIMMPNGAGFVDGILKNFLSIRGEFGCVTGRCLGLVVGDALYNFTDTFNIEPEFMQNTTCNTTFFAFSASLWARLSTRRARWVKRSMLAIINSCYCFLLFSWPFFQTNIYANTLQRVFC